jgi:LacI family transcriptional regulator
MATLREVARLARVSNGTVSNVLTGLVPVSRTLRDRVLSAVQKLDYHPNELARSLKIRQTKMIGMIISDITHPFFSHMIRGAEDAAWSHNYLLVLLNSDQKPDREQQILTALRTRRVDGILIAPTGTEQTQVRTIRDSGIPIVCLERDYPGAGLDCVLADHAKGAGDCIKHLCSIGHRFIGVVHGSEASILERERLRGYRRGLTDAGLDFDAGLVKETGQDQDEIRTTARALLNRSSRPTAILACNALLAAGVLRAIYDAGLRCPQDVAVASFDDPFPANLLWPPLTAVAHPSYEMGLQAMDLLLKRIKDPARRRTRLVIDTVLHIRESTSLPVRGFSSK